MLVFVDNFTAKNSKVVLVNAVTPNFAVLICCNRLKGPFIFYKVGVAMRKKMAFEGGPSQKYKGKRGGHVKYFSKTLKWDNV